jgi:hypothetical protein
MIQLFRIGSADRLLLLLGFYALLHLPYLIFNDHILVQELLRLRLGERLADGWRLYVQAADDTAPLPALLYGLLAKAGLCDFRFLRFFAALLIWYQAMWFNRMAVRYQLVSDRNYLIAFFYLIFIHCSADACSLSPALLGLTFFLYAFGHFFRILKDGANSEDAMLTGLWLGLAGICFQPFLILLIPVFLSAILFSGLRINDYFLILAASLLPSLCFYGFFLFQGGTDDFLSCFLAGFQLTPSLSFIHPGLLLSIASVLLFLSLAAWVFANQNSRVNLQRLGFNVFFFSSLTAFGAVFIGSVRMGESLLLLVPATAFFCAQFTLLSRRMLLNELAGLIIILLFATAFYQQSQPQGALAAYNRDLFLKEPPKGFVVNFRSKSILLLSNDFRFYTGNKAATRFFRYYQSGLRKEMTNTYEGLIYLYQCLEEDPPAIIYDPSGYMDRVAVHMPEFRRCYRSSFYPGLYERVPGAIFGRNSMQKSGL